MPSLAQMKEHAQKGINAGGMLAHLLIKKELVLKVPPLKKGESRQTTLKTTEESLDLVLTSCSVKGTKCKDYYNAGFEVGKLLDGQILKALQSADNCKPFTVNRDQSADYFNNDRVMASFVAQLEAITYYGPYIIVLPFGTQAAFKGSLQNPTNRYTLVESLEQSKDTITMFHRGLDVIRLVLHCPLTIEADKVIIGITPQFRTNYNGDGGSRTVTLK